jgi:endonuclease/exonuclease/phosphatase family metal-dependent hydrolase
LLNEISDEKCILMGDFNVTPDDKVLEPIRAKMKDTAELFSEEKLSFPSDNPKMKIDYIFVSPDIEVVSADIPGIVASDHRPHTAKINI